MPRQARLDVPGVLQHVIVKDFGTLQSQEVIRRKGIGIYTSDKKQLGNVRSVDATR